MQGRCRPQVQTSDISAFYHQSGAYLLSCFYVGMQQIGKFTMRPVQIIQLFAMIVIAFVLKLQRH